MGARLIFGDRGLSLRYGFGSAEVRGYGVAVENCSCMELKSLICGLPQPGPEKYGLSGITSSCAGSLKGVLMKVDIVRG